MVCLDRLPYGAILIFVIVELYLSVSAQPTTLLCDNLEVVMQ